MPTDTTLKPRTPSLREERKLRRAGHELIAGLDEVGRGAWAGPLTIGVAVVRPKATERSMPRWLRDSKMLTESRREEMFEAVGSWCADWAVGHASHEECDELGMTDAWRLAAGRAVADLRDPPEALLVDGPWNLLRSRDNVEAAVYSGDVKPVVRGDAHCASIAAASILAKVVRDRLMRQEAPHFPPYNFESNKGYPSPTHKHALRGYGMSAIHRRSWAFARDLPWLHFDAFPPEPECRAPQLFATTH